jgi:hypothetical protein
MDAETISGGAIAGLAASRSVFKLLKGLVETAKDLGKSEIVNQLLDLQISTMELLNEEQALVEEIRKQRERIIELEERLKIRDQLENHHGAYWRVLPNGKLDGPFSTLSWDRDLKLIRLHYLSQGSFTGRGGHCHLFTCLESKANTFVPSVFIQERTSVRRQG